MSALRPEHCLQAAMERIEQASRLYEQTGSYALVIYLAGLAVECLFRAFKSLKDPVFDERHDLDRLFRESGLQALIPEKEEDEFRAAAADLGALWRNSLRYYSEDRLRKLLKSGPQVAEGNQRGYSERTCSPIASGRPALGRQRKRVMDLLTKARRLLRKAFPRPAKIELDEDRHGIFGTVTSRQFEGLTGRKRIDMLCDALDRKLDEMERKRISFIFPTTPAETRFRREVDNAVNGR